MTADGYSRFRDVDSDSEERDEENEVIDLTHDSDDDDDFGAPQKRVKLDNAVPTSKAPKWSNPDPYTALPPPETLGAPKKDIVQVIRKAKVEAASRSGDKNAVTENADFISFSFDDDAGEANADMGEASLNNRPPANAPVGPASSRYPTRLRTDVGAAQHQSSAPSFNPMNGQLPQLPPEYAGDPPPPPPPGFVFPTDEELAQHVINDSTSKKRKRDDAGHQMPGDVQHQWQANDTDPAPWCTTDHSRTANTGLRSIDPIRETDILLINRRLHKEICDFYNFVRPYEYEEAVRRDLIARIQGAIKSANCTASSAGSSAEIHCFGSFAAGLYLPTADMDLVAVSHEFLRGGPKTVCQTPSKMHKLAHHLVQCGIAATGGTSVVSKARVPIIKFSDRPTGIKVDISFENDSGLLANETFRKWKAQYPAMPVIVVMIKQMLAMRGLNEVFTGGIGGFTVICLVVSMMQSMPELESGSMDGTQRYGDLLLNFLDLYGNKFDIVSTGIVMDPPGYYDKIAAPRVKQNAERLTIIDPNRPDNDISGGSHKINDVLDCFRRGHALLQRRLAAVDQGVDVEDSILGCVWGGNYESFTYQREKLSKLHRGYAVSPPPPPPPAQQKLSRRGKQTANSLPARTPTSNGYEMRHQLPLKPPGQDPSRQKPNGNVELYVDPNNYRPY